MRLSSRFLAVASMSVMVAATAPFLAVTQAAARTPTYLKTLAGPSPAAMYPSGLVWDANDQRLVVADTGFNRISVFQAPNWQNAIFSFGTFGTGDGQFDTPRQVAVDGSSNIYVVDAGNGRVEAFDAAGHFSWTTVCAGTHQACLSTPIGITYDFTNQVLLVADTGHSTIKAFKPSGGPPIWVSPTGFLASPRDAIRGPGGRIWVADYNNEKVEAFDVTSAGVWNTTPAIVLGDGAKAGHALGELNSPYNVQFSPDHNTVYVADTGNERIARWDISGPKPVALDPAFGSRCSQTNCPSPTGNAPYFNALRRVAVDTAGNIWAADFWGSGIHEFSPTGDTAKTNPNYIEIAGQLARVPGFAEAFGIAVGSDGTAYGVDRLNQRVERFDPSGAYQNKVGARGIAPGTFSWPETAAVAPDRTLWVGDTRNDRLQQFDAKLSSKPLVVAAISGIGVLPLNHIEGITVDSRGIVWIADTNNNRIETYNPATKVFAEFGTISGQFHNPQGVAVSASNVYVADTLNNRIVELTLGGSVVATFSTGLSGPQGIALAPDGTLWVADTLNDRVVHLSADLLTDLGNGFGSLGTGNMQFFQPHSLAVHGSVLFVADTFNNRVQEFSI